MTILSASDWSVLLLLLRWRTKQNLDYCFLMMYCQSKGTYYVQVRPVLAPPTRRWRCWTHVCSGPLPQLEDDIVARPNFFTTMKNFALQQPLEEWMILEFSQLGFIGRCPRTRWGRGDPSRAAMSRVPPPAPASPSLSR